MEDVMKEIESGDENRINLSLSDFNEKNLAKYKLGESPDVRKKFCSVLLSNFSSNSWSSDTTLLALSSLRIFTREHEGSAQLISRDGLEPLVHLAGLDKDLAETKQFFGVQNTPEDLVSVMVEAVKCLCNLVLNNHPLANTVADLGALPSLWARLSLSSIKHLPHDLVFFDLRLLFLITACGPDQRVKLRDDLDGLPMLVNLLDSVLYGLPSEQDKVEPVTSSLEKEGGDPVNQSQETEQNKTTSVAPEAADSAETTKAKQGTEAPPEGEDKDKTTPSDEMVKPKEKKRKAVIRSDCFVLPVALSDDKSMLVSETLKIIFSQTVNWKLEDQLNDDEIHQLYQLSHLLRVLICSLPQLQSKATTQTINHCCEVLMNIPRQCCKTLLLPAEVSVKPTLQSLYPSLFLEPQDEDDVSQFLYFTNFDKRFEEHNMAVGVCLLNYLSTRLAEKIDCHGLSIVLGAMSLLSKGNRVFRKFFKSEILPPLGEIKERPDSGQSLKGRLVRLMTAGSHDCMDMVAECLFVLCKENASRLVKHTGYGNAAGLLMTHGLLGGGESQGQSEYSSESGESDTEEYRANQASIDPVTGGPSSRPGVSPLDHMTAEEIEVEAEKLGGLFDQLQSEGMFKMIPLDKENKPITLPNATDSADGDQANQNGNQATGDSHNGNQATENGSGDQATGDNQNGSGDQ